MAKFKFNDNEPTKKEHDEKYKPKSIDIAKEYYEKEYDNIQYAISIYREKELIAAQRVFIIN